MTIDTSNPYENWLRLLQTRDYLRTNPQVDADFYRTHIFLINEYIGVLQGTPDAYMDALPYFQHLVEEYSTKGTFDTGIYLIAVSKLIQTKNDCDINDDLNDAISSLTLR